MNRTKLKSYLETGTNVAVLLAALAALWLVIGGSIKGTRPNLYSGLRKGSLLPSVAGIDYSKSSQTLLIAMSANCEVCADSLPFYNRLRERILAHGSSISVIAVFPEAENEVKKYVQEQHLNLETFSGIDLNSLNLAGTPTMVLIDGSGKIIDFWIGKPSKDIEQEIKKKYVR